MINQDISTILQAFGGSPKALCDAIGINFEKIQPMVLSKKVKRYYRVFEIKKKAGGSRTISAPYPRIKAAQSRISQILYALYETKPSAHGFVRDKDILSNANEHTKKRFVLNLDLKDFFGTINFGRVRGALISQPYRFSEEIATFVAQLCTCDNALPQGAPSSPILSNIICRKLDNDLQKIAKLHACTYTRYADDITFSTTKRKFPVDLANPTLSDENSSVKVELGPVLVSCIKENGFFVNEAKIRMQTHRSRQTVTGLKVNRKVNIERKYLSHVRALLYSWRKFGYASAQTKYQPTSGYDRPVELKKVVGGKIAFIKKIMGEENTTFKKLANNFYELSGDEFRYTLNYHDEIRRNLWVLESGTEPIEQGTAFSIGPNRLITCAHVLKEHTKAFQISNPGKKYDVVIESLNYDIDLAVLSLNDAKQETQSYLKIKYGATLVIGDTLIVAGFPNYSPGHEASITNSSVNTFRNRSGVRRIVVATPIFHGNSGGPVLAPDNTVIGVAVTGALDVAATRENDEYGIIPIDMLKHLKP